MKKSKFPNQLIGYFAGVIPLFLLGCSDGGIKGMDNININPQTNPVATASKYNLKRGTIRIINNYKGWKVGGTASSNFIACPEGWTIAGDSMTNFVVLPPGWTLAGKSGVQFIALPPHWYLDGNAASNFVGLPSNTTYPWSAIGRSTTNYVAVPDYCKAEGDMSTNYVTVPPGWKVAGAVGTNFIALPPEWSLGGKEGTNFVGLAQGWTTAGDSTTNYIALPPGWTKGGMIGTNYIAVPPNWKVGGVAGTNFVTYPDESLDSLDIAFNDPGFIYLLKEALQRSPYYFPQYNLKNVEIDVYDQLVEDDFILAVYLNSQAFFRLKCGPWKGLKPSEMAPAGQW